MFGAARQSSTYASALLESLFVVGRFLAAMTCTSTNAALCGVGLGQA